MKTRLSALLVALLATPLYAQGAPDLALGAVIVTGGGVKVSVANRGNAPSYGCYLELALFDAAGERADSRRQTLKPLPPGQSQEVIFPAEAAFAGMRFQLIVDSSNRIRESDEDNNISEMVDAPAAGAPPIRIPGAHQEGGGRPGPIRIPPADGGGRPAPIRVGDPPAANASRPAPVQIPGKTADTGSKPAPIRIPGKDPAQFQIDLVAVKVSDNGIETTGIIRNDGSLAFTGKRKASLVRETRGSSHVLEVTTVATQDVPHLAAGQTWEMKAKSLRNVKGAKTYTWWLVLNPSDHNGDNDSVSKTVKVVAID